jgi:GH15 family glucan-1,4-alpha-glucosidase
MLINVNCIKFFFLEKHKGEKMIKSPSYLPIEDYGVVGDMHSVALIAKNGSVDFMCLPHFDSPSIFASMLDAEKGGKFQIAPCMAETSLKQLYLPDTNVLLTRFLSEDGIAEISDFMPIQNTSHSHMLVRRLKVIKGHIAFDLSCTVRFNYGRSEGKFTRVPDGILMESTGPDRLRLYLQSSLPLEVEDGKIHAYFEKSAGEIQYFVLQALTKRATPAGRIPENDLKDSFKKTVNFWRDWIRKSTYKGRWLETVHRSALILKLLTSESFGSVVAAPTFGFPEELGGVRNWDYRFTWIRDASFTIYAFIRLGFKEEAAAFMHWIEMRCRELNPDGSLQIMYGLDGKHDLIEESLDHFEGYKNSAPVRIGNRAYDQLQLDIYGELMDSVYLYNKYADPISHDFWKQLTRLVNWVAANWDKPDEGIWEVRGGQKKFLYSRLMCWVALDRGIRLANKNSLPAPLDNWIKIRDTIHHEIHTNFWSEKKQAFVQYINSETLDASNLLMPLVKFISPKDPKWQSTLKAMEKELVEDSLVYRYRTENAASDGLTGEEGTFCMCSFWYVECLSRGGDIQKARFYFEKMLGYANHLGLYAEELGPKGEHLGNFPQAFTHLGLISAAYNLNINLS